MGSRMVANLLTNAGQEVVVCDDRSQALHDAAALGAETVSTPAALAANRRQGLKFREGALIGCRTTLRKKGYTFKF
jgi:hypothetical protein